MRIIQAFTLALLLCLLVGHSPAVAEGTRFDGEFWRQSDAETRRLFVYGFVSGVVQGQDRVARQLVLKTDAGEFRPECHAAVSKNANRLETEMTRMDRRLFMRALDAFYAAPSNRALELKWAVLVVMQQLQGTSKADIESYIEELKSRTP